MRDFLTLEEFFDWLEDRDAFHPFVENCPEETIEEVENKVLFCLPLTIRQNPISCCFVWRETKEGSIYWNSLDDEYIKEFG